MQYALLREGLCLLPHFVGCGGIACLEAMLNLTNEWLKTILILLYLGLLADSGLPGEALGGVTLLFYPNFFRGKLPPNKIGLFLIRRACTLNIKIGGELGRVELSGEGGIGDSGSYWCPRNRRLQFHPLRTFHPS